MKYLKYVILLGVIVGFIACEKEASEEYYSTLGILTESNDSLIIDSDKSNRLYIYNNIGNELDSGDRVAAIFKLVDMDIPEGLDYIIEVTSIEKVLFKPIITDYTPAKDDSLGNDPVQIDELWLAKDFMNLNFTYLGGSTTHFINLVLVDSVENDTVELEIRHNDNDDTGIYQLKSFVSFDLTSVQSAATDSVILRIKAQEFNDYVFDENIVYRY
jgi:hypothetical protein